MYIRSTNRDKRMREDDDEIINYGNETRMNILELIYSGVCKGVEIRGEKGAIYELPLIHLARVIEEINI